MKEETEKGKDACKSVNQSGRLRTARIVFTLRQHDAFRVSGEYNCSQYCTVKYCHCHKTDLEIIYRDIYNYCYCIQDSEKYTQRRKNGSKCYLDREKSTTLKLSHTCICVCVCVKACGSLQAVNETEREDR